MEKRHKKKREEKGQEKERGKREKKPMIKYAATLLDRGVKLEARKIEA